MITDIVKMVAVALGMFGYMGEKIVVIVEMVPVMVKVLILWQKKIYGGEFWLWLGDSGCRYFSRGCFFDSTVCCYNILLVVIAVAVIIVIYQQLLVFKGGFPYDSEDYCYDSGRFCCSMAL